jgi:hypothetical protein
MLHKKIHQLLQEVKEDYLRVIKENALKAGQLDHDHHNGHHQLDN